MMSRLFVTVVSVVLASGASIAAQDAKQVAAGKKVYDTYNCQKCHSVGGVGSKVSPLDGVATKLTAEDIHKWLVTPDEMTAKLKKKPKVKMKTQEYKPGEVDAVMAYLATLK
ncbi:MAG: cytochrome c [Acidobacteriota bacterium]